MLGLWADPNDPAGFEADRLKGEAARAALRRAITGKETDADVARIHGGAQWLQSGINAGVQGAKILQDAATQGYEGNLDRNAAMDQLRAKIQGEQGIEGMRSESAMNQLGAKIQGEKDLALSNNAWKSGESALDRGVQREEIGSRENIAKGGWENATKLEGMRGATQRAVATIGADASKSNADAARRARADQAELNYRLGMAKVGASLSESDRKAFSDAARAASATGDPKLFEDLMVKVEEAVARQRNGSPSAAAPGNQSQQKDSVNTPPVEFSASKLRETLAGKLSADEIEAEIQRRSKDPKFIVRP